MAWRLAEQPAGATPSTTCGAVIKGNHHYGLFTFPNQYCHKHALTEVICPFLPFVTKPGYQRFYGKIRAWSLLPSTIYPAK
jgi:hypothetical protein